jgi:hypothetical protein
MYDHDHIVAFALYPAMIREHAIPIVHMHDAKALPTQATKTPAQIDQLPGESHMIGHLLRRDK